MHLQIGNADAKLDCASAPMFVSERDTVPALEPSGFFPEPE
jgi:hypothetical protein